MQPLLLHAALNHLQRRSHRAALHIRTAAYLREVAAGDEAADVVDADDDAAAVGAHHEDLDLDVLLAHLPYPVPRQRVLRREKGTQSVRNTSAIAAS